MNKQTADILNSLTRDFYLRCAASFSATRQEPWQGWKTCLQQAPDLFHLKELNVLDVACGNLRFERFIRDTLPGRMNIWAIDVCSELLPDDICAKYVQLDIISKLLGGSSLSEDMHVPACDLSCSFGFMHHIPSSQARFRLLDELVASLRPGGYCFISFWQFSQDARLERKAQEATSHALGLYPQLQLDHGDWLLPWKEETEVFRYCHDFSDEEVTACVEHMAPKARLVKRFKADGKNAPLNHYLVLQKL